MKALVDNGPWDAAVTDVPDAKIGIPHPNGPGGH
jgi:hypothetical protein